MGDVLVVNAGSTSLKLHRVAPDETSAPVAGLEAVDAIGIEAVAHRVVHGGEAFVRPALIDPAVRRAIDDLEPLAPLHNAPALDAIDEALRRFPDTPQVAVFDTLFHASMPPEAREYAVPRRWRDEWGVRRYGFHGLSVAWAAERSAALLGRAAADLRLVVCHLGGGCSVTAVAAGRSCDTTMGFSPLEGVPMATRSGSIDPAVLVYLERTHGMDADDIDHALTADSGLLGLGGSGDMRDLEAAARDGSDAARLAIDVFCHRVAGAVGRWRSRPAAWTRSSLPAASARARPARVPRSLAASACSAPRSTRSGTTRSAATATSPRAAREHGCWSSRAARRSSRPGQRGTLRAGRDAKPPRLGKG